MNRVYVDLFFLFWLFGLLYLGIYKMYVCVYICNYAYIHTFDYSCLLLLLDIFLQLLKNCLQENKTKQE